MQVVIRLLYSPPILLSEMGGGFLQHSASWGALYVTSPLNLNLEDQIGPFLHKLREIHSGLGLRIVCVIIHQTQSAL
jgi:hypothetical protein